MLQHQCGTTKKVWNKSNCAPVLHSSKEAVGTSNIYTKTFSANIFLNVSPMKPQSVCQSYAILVLGVIATLMHALSLQWCMAGL